MENKDLSDIPTIKLYGLASKICENSYDDIECFIYESNDLDISPRSVRASHGSYLNDTEVVQRYLNDLSGRCIPVSRIVETFHELEMDNCLSYLKLLGF